MIFTGITRTFSLENEQQYETIGAFWSEMEQRNDCSCLRGLGYNWTENTTEYVIGLTEGAAEGSDCTVILPDDGWIEVRGRTADLGEIYDRIYKDGALTFEIESYYNGSRYELFTSTRSKDNIRMYQKAGYEVFDQKVANDELVFVYLEKESLCLKCIKRKQELYAFLLHMHNHSYVYS